jgi:hypothetical protein
MDILDTPFVGPNFEDNFEDFTIGQVKDRIGAALVKGSGSLHGGKRGHDHGHDQDEKTGKNEFLFVHICLYGIFRAVVLSVPTDSAKGFCLFAGLQYASTRFLNVATSASIYVKITVNLNIRCLFLVIPGG